MIIDIEKLKKIDDIISCEGSILSVYKFNNKLYLATHLSDGTGEVFYSTNTDSLLSYLNSKITLSDLYQSTNDVFVTKKFQNDSKLFLCDDFSKLIQFGELTLNQINKDYINHDFIVKVINDFLS